VSDSYYIGHYGQLGPLTLEQMDELIQGGVISQETYVWRTGLAEWSHAGSVTELSRSFAASVQFAAPPPPPIATVPPASTATMANTPYQSSTATLSYPAPYGGNFTALRSDRSRTLAGILQLVLPGVGRIYLGYAAYGVLQLVLTFCFLVGLLWSFIDGILILAGSPKLDGYGRVLGD
jgi:hypothetical protein